MVKKEMNKKEKLIEKFLAEKEKREGDTDFFGNSIDNNDYDYAIEYLKTGKVPSVVNDIYDYDILQGVVEDLETTYLDYEVK